MIEEALNVVGMRGEEMLEKYPHQLSGGQRQRMMMARAYLLKPSLIVADEPVSMVDASLRAMILDIMLRLRDEIGFRSCTSPTISLRRTRSATRSIVLYQGIVAEQGRTGSHREPQASVRATTDRFDPGARPEREMGREDHAAGRRADARQASERLPLLPRCPQRMERCLAAAAAALRCGCRRP